MTDSTNLLILASSSKYRQDLLRRLRIPFSSYSPDVDESQWDNETPLEMALRLSKLKARKIWSEHTSSIVIGADQVASLRGKPIGKPGSMAAAQQQLQKLSGQTVIFHSALTVISASGTQTLSVPTTCVFRELDSQAIAHYLNIDQAWDTAGSAKAESLGIALMQSMESTDPTAIIGLPLIALTRLLCQAGLDPLAPRRGPEC